MIAGVAGAVIRDDRVSVICGGGAMTLSESLGAWRSSTSLSSGDGATAAVVRFDKAS